MNLTHFRFEVDADGVATVTIDRADDKLNTLDPALMEDFDSILTRIESDPAVKAVILTSGKPDNFLAGANIKWFAELTDAAEANWAIEQGHALFDRLERLHAEGGKPVIAAIHGTCLGGGNELVLACSGRIATDHPQTRLGQPEVQLGVLPAGGGTQRLPALIGVASALELLLKGRPVDARKARKLGLVDEAVPPTMLMEIAHARAKEATAGGPRPSPRSRLNPSQLQRLALESNPLGRAIMFRQARKQLLAETKGNYPAPEKTLEAVRIGLEEGRKAGLAAEARFFGQLVTSPESLALRSVFFATRSGPSTEGARPVEVVGVLGGGLMGAGIAAVSTMTARARVRVKEVDAAGIARALGYVSKVVGERVEKRRLTEFEGEQAMLRVTAGTDWAGFENADLVIEAVFEDLALKQGILKEAEDVIPAGAVFASNTSSLPISAIASASSRPASVVGMHYFSPVEKMPLLEVVTTEHTSDEAEATAVAFGKRQGKTVIVVNDGVGFYTSRILGPYTAEAFHLLAGGASIDAIDGAMEEWGFPVGPLRLSDEVGIDVGAKISVILVDAFGERMAGPDLMSGLVASDRKGRKNRRGFYSYDDSGKRGAPDESVYADLGVEPTGGISRAEIQDRMSLALVNEAVRCLEEDVLRSAADGDVGAVMGIGFPPFRGGPFFWIDQVGASEVVDRLRRCEEIHGSRFEPAAMLVEAAATGRKFRAG